MSQLGWHSETLPLVAMAVISLLAWPGALAVADQAPAETGTATLTADKDKEKEKDKDEGSDEW